jgi:hypothetical protein
MPNDQPLTPGPRRMKSYTGGQGYVYQYYFVGKRAALAGDPYAPATEYIFDTSADRKITFSVSVFLPQEVLNAWAATHGRPLTEAEQYGGVKMRLFQAFDEIENMLADGRRLLVNSELLEHALSNLGVQ